MNEILANLGFDPKIALVTIFNFTVVLLVLQRFVFSKLNNSLGERQSIIEESLQNAEKLKHEVANAEQKAADIIAEANREANDLKSRHQEELAKWETEQKSRVQHELDIMKEEARNQIENERSEMLESLRRQTAELALQATSKILKDKFSEEDDKEIIAQYLYQLEHHA